MHNISKAFFREARNELFLSLENQPSLSLLSNINRCDRWQALIQSRFWELSATIDSQMLLNKNLLIASFIASKNNITLFEFRASCNFWNLRKYLWHTKNEFTFAFKTSKSEDINCIEIPQGKNLNFIDAVTFKEVYFALKLLGPFMSISFEEFHFINFIVNKNESEILKAVILHLHHVILLRWIYRSFTKHFPNHTVSSTLYNA